MPYCLLILFLLISMPLRAETALTLNTTGNPPLNTPEQSGFMDLVTKQALARIGYQLKTVQLPAERGLINANAGIEDGEMSRIAGLERIYSNLIRVPEKIMDWEFVVFSKKVIDLHNGWHDLAQQQVAFINGWKIFEKNTPDSSFVTKVREPEQLFKLLRKNRTDYLLYERWGGLALAAKLQMDDVLINDPPLAVREMFIYLHKKHIDLVPKLARTLREMKQDGSYTDLFYKKLRPYEPN